MADIYIETLEVSGFASAFQALRLPFGKECRSWTDSLFRYDKSGVNANPANESRWTHVLSEKDKKKNLVLVDNYVKQLQHIRSGEMIPPLPTIYTASATQMDPKDLHLMSTLVKRGDEHAKVVRGIMVYAEIEAPIWFYRELETYRIGRERLSCESTMHIECRGLGGEELEKAKDEIPMGHMQRTVDMFSYQCLRRIYFQRRNHRLPMWQAFCKWIESLPLAEELILQSQQS